MVRLHTIIRIERSDWACPSARKVRPHKELSPVYPLETPVEEHHASTPSSSNVSFWEKHYFLIRRLHSLSGIVPVGVFLCVHLLANASVLAPGASPGAEFQKAVDRIHSLGPLLLPVEIVGIFLPILFHALVGFQIAFTARPNAQQYRYGGNVRYTLQRLTGYVAFVFILYHVWHMHWLGAPIGGGKFDPHAAPATAAAAIQAAWWVAPVYALGVLSSVFHFANGIWTALITWGITIRPTSQRASGYVCAVVGVLLAAVGLGALSGFRTMDSKGATQPATHSASAKSG